MTDLVKIEWLKEKTNHKIGDTMEISEKLAEFLEKKGDCKILDSIKPFRGKGK